MRYRNVLLVDSDSGSGRALALVLRRQGDRVRLVQTRSQALLAVRRNAYDLAVVDLFVAGGGVELARELFPRIPRLFLSLGARLDREEVLEAALGFPVHHKAALPALLRARVVSSSDRASGARRRGSRRPHRGASGLAREPRARERDRDRRLAG